MGAQWSDSSECDRTIPASASGGVCAWPLLHGGSPPNDPNSTAGPEARGEDHRCGGHRRQPPPSGVWSTVSMKGPRPRRWSDPRPSSRWRRTGLPSDGPTIVVGTGRGDLFTAQNVLDGKAITESHVQHRHPEMLALRSTLHRHVDPHWAVRVVLDDLSTTRPSTFRGVATAHAVPAPLRPDGGPEEPGLGAEDPRSHCREESDLRRPDTLSSVGDGPPGSVSAPPSPFVEGVLHRTGAATNLT